MNQELITINNAEIVERVVIAGDLSKLSAADRVAYYRATCDSLGLNSLTKPFEYIELSGKLTLYATRTATDQLREMKRISLRPVRKELNTELNIYIVEVEATTPDGRTDFATGVVSIAKEDGTWESSQSGKRFFKGNGQWKQFRGDDLANALMKAETKAKRRATLSVCGLGWMDETEVENVATAQRVHVDTATGEIVSPPTRTHTNGKKPGQVEDAPLPPITDQQRAQANGERPLVKRLRELVNDCRGAGVAVPSLPKPKEMTDEALYTAIEALETEYSKAQQAADQALDEPADLFAVAAAEPDWYKSKD